MTLKAARQSIERLVGVPYRIHGRSIEDGLDCVTLASYVYSVIAGVTGDAAAWSFPPLRDYRRGSIDPTALREYWKHWEPCEPRTFGSIVKMKNHIGVDLGDGRIIHARSTTGVIISREATLRPVIEGHYRRRREPCD